MSGELDGAHPKRWEKKLEEPAVNSRFSRGRQPTLERSEKGGGSRRAGLGSTLRHMCPKKEQALKKKGPVKLRERKRPEGGLKHAGRD